ncbi:toll/interleukin-1 receptor domain-containing protein [Streptomyces sp. NPDC048241]|uniref:toll/interleukin-1 receptor domain-containing protein n=1 Tax=Streptomyces sp. NPDC048241 TaxID=3365521 RepID=UPI003713330C
MFISHSTSADERTGRLLDALAEGLDDREHEVLLDKRIKLPGRPWELKLARFLGECDAALVLVNKAALGSSWVRRETNILHWRKTLYPGMVLVTVLVDGVGAGELRKSDLRYLATDDVERMGPDTAPEVARLAGLFPRLRQAGDDGVGLWLENIGIVLREIKDESVFARMARELDIPAEEHAALIPGFAPLLLASQMLDTHEVDHLLKAILVARMGGLERERVDDLARMILPVWVDRDDARRIVSDTDGSVRRVVVLTVNTPLIGHHYLARAFCVDTRSYYIAEADGRPPGDDDPEDHLLDQCERAVKYAIGLDADDDLDGAEEPRGFGRLFLLLDATRCDLAVVHRVLDRLHGKVSWLNVLVIPGRGVDVRESWPGNPDEVLVLDPRFEAGHETLVTAVDRRVRDCVQPNGRRAW